MSEFKCWCEGMMAIPNSHSCTYEKRIHDLQAKLDCAVRALEEIECFEIMCVQDMKLPMEIARLALEEIRK